MSETPNLSPPRCGPEMKRWAAFTHEEACLIHHALRMLAKHPMIGEDGPAATKLADEFWDLHAARVSEEIRDQ